MRNTFVLSILLLAFAAGIAAEPNSYFPRRRMFVDIADREDVARGVAPDRFYNGTEGNQIDTDGAYDSELMRAGAGIDGYSEYMWRDFLVADKPALGLQAYFGVYGVELSIFSLVNTEAPEGSTNPFETDYRISYNFDFWQSINSIAFTHYDFSNSHDVLGFQGQGFGSEPIEFADKQNELHLLSTFFNDKIQTSGANTFLSLEANYWLDEGGVRGQATVGIAAYKSAEVDWYLPNNGMVSASFIGQSHYHRDTSSFVGSNFHGEFGWDLRTQETPISFTLFMDYFLPWGDDNYLDRIIYGFSFELRWSGPANLGIF